jgi:hypothetical protein
MKLLWYGFIAVFVVIGLSMAVLNGAGVIFGMAFVGMAVLLQMLYSILGELRATRMLTEQHLIAQTRVADNLEWLMFAPEGEKTSESVPR